ncbi:hypothetical protein ACPUYX_20065 [Desulfosporosinus sp. SYSU MS00001]|uniref:hypothetical protein n=1 Tax=Desulfosporosinus sp. SYSU MS00001 TaxID=3416284 RepID=UPI003CEC9C52
MNSELVQLNLNIGAPVMKVSCGKFCCKRLANNKCYRAEGRIDSTSTEKIEGIVTVIIEVRVLEG